MDRIAGRQAIYLDNNQALEQACAELAFSEVLGFDSEFMRTNTYFPKPGLFQLGDGQQTFLVDPLGIDRWDSFRTLLQRESLILVIHSSSEDLGLLRSFLGVLPANLFDTQRAAAFAGLGYSLSYQALVKNELDVEIPKGETRSDWLRRPLSETQLDYAALDVEYLVEIQQRLQAQLRERRMLEWFEADCRDLLAGVPDEMDPTAWENAYLSISSAWQLDGRALQLLQKLAFWREQEARLRNKPRSWVVKDAELQALAEKLSGQDLIDEAAIRRTGVFSSRFADREAQKLARFLNQDREFARPASPDLLSRPLGGAVRRQLKALQTLARERAETLDISPELLARKKLWLELLENVASDRLPLWPPGLDNWRRELLEPAVMAILAKGGAE
ncbi:MAG: ribonuclease D [Gammaproteobacteria bacterium]|nr:ribonuclease D [Pseudomonadales bacterium]MCP5346285.1 ribonuclease D [Pseudomonadales bacterium]